MSNGFLLDTNAVIAFRTDSAPFVLRFGRSGLWFVSVVTLGELCFGALKSPRPNENLEWLTAFVNQNQLIPCDKRTAYQYGYLRDATRRSGRPMPANDTWIAATAIQYNLVLVTRDAHFDHIEGLTCLSW